MKASFLLAYFLVLASSAYPSTAQEEVKNEPVARFGQIMSMHEKVQQLESQGKKQETLSLLKQMMDSLKSLQQAHPNWQKDVISRRANLTKDKILTLEKNLAERTSPSVAPLNDPALTSSFSDQMPVDILDLIRKAQAHQMDIINQLKKDKNNLESKIEQWITWHDWAQEEIKTSRQERDAIAGSMNEIQQQLSNLKQSADQGAIATEKNLQLQEQLKALSEQKVALDSKIFDKENLLTEESAKIKTLEEQLTLINREKETLTEEVAILKEQNTEQKNQFDDLQKEFDLWKSEGTDKKTKKIIDEAARLRSELASAKTQISELSKTVKSKDKEITSLTSQLTKVQSELEVIKKENAEQKNQIADYALKIKQFQDNPPLSAKTAEEQKILKTALERSTRDALRQQQIYDNLIIELSGIENVSKEILSQVSDLNKAKFTLNPDEKNLLIEPSSNNNSADVRGSFVAKNKESPTSANDPIMEMIEAANQSYEQGDYKKCVTQYEEILRKDSKNLFALVGIAYAKMKLKKYTEADAILQKAIKIDANNPEIYFALARSRYSQKAIKDAMKHFEKSLELQSDNPEARYYLGIIANKLDQPERAEREFKTAIALNTNYADAYYNLAVIYTSSKEPKWKDAQDAYQSAITLGASPNEDLKTLIEKNLPSSKDTPPANAP
jgi:Flp pilus assembly protein TadD